MIACVYHSLVPVMNDAPLVADLFLFSYESEFMKNLS